MSAGGLLLRVVLMLSLFLNGLNAAMAGPMVLAMAMPAAPIGDAPAPPCHGEGHAAMHGDQADAPAPAQAPDDSEHCRIKDCLRNCAQQPGLTAQIAWIPTPPPLSPAPLPATQDVLRSPPLDRITRPPIA